MVLGQDFEGIKKRLLEWFTINLPDWASAKIASHGEYLGFMLGPTAQSEQLLKVFPKWSQRISDIKEGKTSMFISIHACNFHAVSVLTYKGQLLLFPQGFLDKEDGALASLPRVPHRSLGSGGYFALDGLGSRIFGLFWP